MITSLGSVSLGSGSNFTAIGFLPCPASQRQTEALRRLTVFSLVLFITESQKSIILSPFSIAFCLMVGSSLGRPSGFPDSPALNCVSLLGIFKIFYSLLQGNDNIQERDYAFSETGGLQGPFPSPKEPNVFCIKTHTHKLIHFKSNNVWELYDLANDPLEQNNLINIHDGISSTILSSFASPSTFIQGLAFANGNLISTDDGTGLIYIHDGISSTILSSFVSGGLSGLTFANGNLISVTSIVIQVHDGISNTILSSFSTPSTNPQGLAFANGNLISTDSNTDLIYIHDGISSTILSSFSTPALDTQALAFANGNLISGDVVTNLIYIHNNDSTFSGSALATATLI